MIEDTALFTTFGQANFGSGASFGNFENNYGDYFDGYFFVNGEIKARELTLLKMLENSGLKLFRGNSNFSDWQVIEIINKDDDNLLNHDVINDDCN